MEKRFNVTGTCLPDRHYMVDLTERIKAIRKMVENEDYFSINRGRQYGKTTTLYSLKQLLKDDYVVLSLDFQVLDSSVFENVDIFSRSFCDIMLFAIENIDDKCISDVCIQELKDFSKSNDPHNFKKLSLLISKLCKESKKPIVLLIDEVDSASNYDVFVDFLAMLRQKYLNRDDVATFQSVILAGVWDIRYLKAKIRPDAHHKINSPWNIAAEFNVRMWFNEEEIEGMIRQYENDHHSGMNIEYMSQRIFDYTQGYPVMVSWLCKAMDEKLGGVFSNETLDEAVKMMVLDMDVPVFDSMMHQIDERKELETMLKNLVFQGQPLPYNPDDYSVKLGIMFSYLRRDGERCMVANWIFEQRLFRYFVNKAMKTGETNRAYNAGGIARNMFITNDGRLNMDRVMSKFVEYFNDIYNDKDADFVEKMGRKLFILYLKPIINGTGNYYIEAETRDETRTDLVIDYAGDQFVVEMKIWHGDEYKERGERHLRDYLGYFHLNRGYLLSFSFNKNKKTGINTIELDGKTIVEAVV